MKSDGREPIDRSIGDGLATSPTLELLSISTPEPHAKTPVDAAMIRKTNP